jgi:CRP-like cAMP-binding protein
MDERTEGLQAIPLFASLDETDLSDIAGLLIERKFPRDAVIFEEGTLGDYMYLIREGQVKVTKMSEDGREKILEMFGPGDFFGDMSLFDREPRSASIKTTKACVLMALSRHDFLELLRRNPDVSMQVIQELSRRLREADEQIRSLLFERVEGRTRQLLVRMAREPVADRPDRLGTPAVTHQQLADLVGTSRETVTRVIKELKAEGWLEQVGKQYLVVAGDEPAR